VTREERVRSFLETDSAGWYNLVNVNAHDRGGHFVPWEIPVEWVDDLRHTFSLATSAG
jgi:microsomal epoxide hydrolase